MDRCQLWLTTEEIKPERLEDATVVVIDVLLATTTLVTIMERGARRIFPVENVEEAKQLKAKLNHSSILTGGEQGGKAVQGFDCAHLPDEYTPELVKDKDIIFLSSNGTRAISKAKQAQKLILGNLRNVNTVADYLNHASTKDVIIICAGSGGHFSLEDYVCANLILSRLNIEDVKLNDAALFALNHPYNSKEAIAELLAKGRVGRNLMKLGMEELFQFTVDIGASESNIGIQSEGELGFIPQKLRWE
ncbi:2-phosphosulfolactate phosphatase [Geomicrobium halophilum]|uniref:Probable 2-phosphosulfolactate phosphatase n=1 Tax=Geomicrobium halophilum TaxID=549000 RepID=A0A841PUQ2_9BACL|nr:2-phosphosulfolactate phosphatase [Geomicrobium halophilum]MBB6450866.1 2-phosphosulfolactate phosphatase [Geomicrobium halophilum]